MLVCTEGRERTLSEYRQLLEAAGFEQVQGRVTGAYLDAVIARKP
jgi:acetylserotonin N-methyltransferase